MNIAERIRNIGAFKITNGGFDAIRLPTGETYKKITLVCSSGNIKTTVATMKLVIKNIRLVIGGQTLSELSATQFLDIEKTLANLNKAGEINLYFSRPDLESEAQRFLNSFPTLGLAEQFSVELNFASNITTYSAYISNINCVIHTVNDAQLFGSTPTVQFVAFGFSHTTASKQSIVELPIAGNGDEKYDGFFVEKNTFSKISLSVNSRRLLDEVSKNYLDNNNLRAGRIVAGNVFFLDLNEKGTFGDGITIVGLNEMSLEFTWTTAPQAYEIVAIKTVNLNGKFFS